MNKLSLKLVEGCKEKKTRVEINEIESKKTIEKIIETKIYCFEKINKIDKTLSGLTKK